MTPTTLPREYQPDARGPLHGCRVLDLSRLVSGGHCGLVLADLGADVIKIERPDGGDELRGGRVAGVAAFWTVYNRNKRSVALDLKSAEGRGILLELVRSADALLENFRPGTLEKLGLAPDILQDVNPKLVVTRISGWGQTGPYAHLPGFGTLAEAVSGFMNRNGYADRPPAPPPTALADMVAGLYAATATIAAILHAREGGLGQTIDVSLFEPLASLMGPDALLDQLGHLPTRGEGTRASSVKGVFLTSDAKWVALSAGAERIVRNLFVAIGEEAVLSDPRFTVYQSRLDHRDEINAVIARWIQARPLAEVLSTLQQQGVTIAPVLSMPDARSDPHFVAREVYVDVPGRDGEPDRIAMHNIVPRMSGTPSGIRRPAPRLGEHSEEVLAEIGIAGEQLRDLTARRIVVEPAKADRDA